MHYWLKFQLFLAFDSGVLLSPDGNPSPDGSLACMIFACSPYQNCFLGPQVLGSLGTFIQKFMLLAQSTRLFCYSTPSSCNTEMGRIGRKWLA